MVMDHPSHCTNLPSREGVPPNPTPLVLTAVVDLELLDDDVADLLRALGVGRLVLFVVELFVRGGRGAAGDQGPDEVHGGGGERAAGDAEEEPDDDHEDVPGALLGPGGRRVGGVGELGAADLDVGGDGVEVVVGAVAVVEMRAEAADAEHGDDRGDVGDAAVVVGGAVAAAGAGVWVGREGDEEGAAGARVGGEEGRGGDGEQQEDTGGGHGGNGGGEPDLCPGKGKKVRSEKMELGVDTSAVGCEENPRGTDFLQCSPCLFRIVRFRLME